jgi:hypothetical protein
MDSKSFYQRKAQRRYPAAQVSGDGPHGVLRADQQELILYSDFYDARTAADVSGGRLIFIHKPVAGFYQDLGYRDKRASA